MIQGYTWLMMQFKILSTMLHLYVKPPPCLTKAKSLVGARSQDKKRVRRQSSGLPFPPLPSHLRTFEIIFSPRERFPHRSSSLVDQNEVSVGSPKTGLDHATLLHDQRGVRRGGGGTL